MCRKRLTLTNCCVLFCVLYFAPKGFAQEVRVFGVIRDINTHGEIHSVNVYIKDTNIGTSSDYSGRYSLQIHGTTNKMIVVFRHIAYETKGIPVDSLRTIKYVYLQPRVIPLQGVEIEEKGVRSLEIDKDLPQAVSIMEARNFDIRGYVDAGDLLRTDHSVQIDEELSGQKTASIRGGNPDEVIVLYNGTKMNSTFDNVFDLSLIDLEDIDRFELIKGSNTALYGPEAFSGVINIVPKLEQNYTIRFQQRLGTYRSGNFGLHLYKKFHRFQGSYSYKRGGFRRTFVDTPEDRSRLKNSSLHHTGNFSYSISEKSDGSPANTIGFMWIYTSLDFDNQRDDEKLSNSNKMFSLKYTGDIAAVKNLDLSVSYRELDEDQSLSFATGTLRRGIGDKSLHINVEKGYKFRSTELLFAYQFQNAELGLVDVRNNFEELPIGLQGSDFRRQHHGFVTIAKFHGDTGAEFLQNVDFDASFRHDIVKDTQSNSIVRSGFVNEGDSTQPGIFNNNNWQNTTVKFSVNATGYRNGLFVNTYLNFGSNIKFPTLFQQVSSPLVLTGEANKPSLSPEKNRSLELGVVITKDTREHPSIYGWQFSANYFLNNYENKFRFFTTPGIPIAFFDNVQDARISGLESKTTVFLFRKKVSVALGLSRYFISEQAAFPFRSENKRTLNFTIDHAGYSFDALWFKEGEQVGLLRFLSGEFGQVFLPEYTNLDVHLSKTFAIGDLKLFANVSGRNLLNDNDVELRGLSIRDRRFYITIGAQY
ncbi:MAG: TonB-dependent receptor plug domain-containing protein [bacterium]